MSDIKLDLNVDGKAINDAVVAAIIDSTLGESLKREVTEAVKGIRFGRDNLYKRAIEQQIRLIVIDLVNTEYREQIAEYVRTELAKQDYEALVVRMVGRMFQELDLS